MSILTHGLRLLAALPLTLVIALAAASDAFAYQQPYCGRVLTPSADPTCQSSGLHSFRFNRGSYPGNPAHSVLVCEYMWNNSTEQVRGGAGWYYHCGNNYVAKGLGSNFATIV